MNIPIKSLLLFFLFLSNVHAFCVENELPVFPAQNDFCTFQVSLEKETYSVCEPIVLSCTVTVVSATPIIYSMSAINHDFDLTVLDSSNETAPYTTMGRLELAPGTLLDPASSKGIFKQLSEIGGLKKHLLSSKIRHLKNGETIRTRFLLNRYFDLTGEGEYAVSLVARSIEPVWGKRVAVKSPNLKFKVSDDGKYLFNQGFSAYNIMDGSSGQ